MRIDTRDKLVCMTQKVLIMLTGKCEMHELQLMIGTASVESDFEYRYQFGGGPARGLWGMEIGTAEDIFVTYLNRPEKANLFRCLTGIWLNLRNIKPFIPDRKEIEYFLVNDDRFACALARIKYLRDSQPIPYRPEKQGEYWKRVYNTSAGKGTRAMYMRKWHANECEKLIVGGQQGHLKKALRWHNQAMEV